MDRCILELADPSEVWNTCVVEALPFLCFLVVGGLLAILMHELAHAGVGWAVGMKVTRVQIGWGAEWCVVRWLGVDWAVCRKLLSGGCVHAGLLRGRWARVLYCTMVAAGPLMNLMMVCVCVSVVRPLFGGNYLGGQPTLMQAAIAVGLMNLWFLVGSFGQPDVRITGKPMQSDGQILLQVWRDPHIYDEWIAWAEAHQRAKAEGDDCAGLCDLLNAMGRHVPWEELRGIFLARIKKKRRGHPRRLAAIDVYCTWAVFSGQRENIAEVDSWSAELFEYRGREYTVWGTRGSVMLFNGKMQEGVELLTRMMAEDDSPLDRAIGGCFLAWAAQQSGDTMARDRWWDESLRANGEKPAIAWVAQELFPGTHVQSTKISV
ncbi:MAG TPA: site-2 protease family protein [Opitutaceae bacterium]